MNTILDRYKFAAMLTALGGALMGLLMLLFPTVAVKIVCYVLGGCVLLTGLAGLVFFSGAGSCSSRGSCWHLP